MHLENHWNEEIGVSTSSARTATKLLKLRPYKTTVSHALQLRVPASRVRFCTWFLQSVVGGEIDPQLTSFSDEAWFHLQEYINTQNNGYWISKNPHLTREAPLYPVKVGVWCAVSVRRVVAPVFLTKQLIVKHMYRSFSDSYFQS
jgi:hypothetical protein